MTTDWDRCEAVERRADVFSGAFVFAGTRVPLHALFENLQGGATTAKFVDWFPNVTIEQVNRVLEHQINSLLQVPAG